MAGRRRRPRVGAFRRSAPFGDAGEGPPPPDDDRVRAGELARRDDPRSPGQLTKKRGRARQIQGASGAKTAFPRVTASREPGRTDGRTTNNKTIGQLGQQNNRTNKKKKTKRRRRGDRVQGCDDPSRDWDLGLSPDPHDLAPAGEDGRICRRQRAKIGEERVKHPAARDNKIV